MPQRFWSSYSVIDFQTAKLQLPVFFCHHDGSLGLTVEAAMRGQSHTLINANYFAPLGIDSQKTTQIRIGVSIIYSAVVDSLYTESATTFQWPGYRDFTRKICIRDRMHHRNLVTLITFAQLIGQIVGAFLEVSLLCLDQNLRTKLCIFLAPPELSNR